MKEYHIDEKELDYLLSVVKEEFKNAVEKHGLPTPCAHECYAVLKEEVDEYWDCVKEDRIYSDSLKEAQQVAAMAIRHIYQMRRA